MSLKLYNQKRNFDKTSEPKGVKKDAKKDFIFVVQYHKARAKHYDFRLEWNGVLLSWAVPKGPSYNPDDKRLAVHVEDHPLDYANFEGIIPEGNYGAGSVEIFDSGTYFPSFDMDKGLKKGHLKFVLNGKRFKGEWSLVKMDDKNWLLIKSQDEFANLNKNDVKNSEISKISEKSLKNSEKNAKKCKIEKNIDVKNKNKIKNAIKKQKLPFKKAEVQLAKLTNTIPVGKEWLFEIKYDGYRLLSFVENGKVTCLTRGGKDYTSKFPEIAKSLSEIDENCFVCDGEVVAFDQNGRSDFGLLQERIKSKSDQIDYCIFDLLALDGVDLRQKPLFERKKMLLRLFSKEKPHLIYSQHVEDNGKACFEFAKQHNLEGIIAKKADSIYAGSRNGDWLKIKCYNRQEFVVCGYTVTDKNQVLSALVVGFYQNNKLVFAGKVGTGFDEKDKVEISKKLNKITTKKCSIDVFPQKIKLQAVWIKPKLVAEIQFAEFTKDGVLRQPSFVGLREDKDAKSVKFEVPDE